MLQIRILCRTVAVRCAAQLAVSEALVWHVADLLQRLQAQQARSLSAAAANGSGGGEAAAEAGAAGAAGAGHDTAAADMPLRIGLLHVDDLRAEVSFQGDPLSRPRCAILTPL